MKFEIGSRIRNFFGRTWVMAACAGLLIILILPGMAIAQFGLDPCCAIISVGLSAISNLLKGGVAPPIGQIQQTQQQDFTFQQNVVYPLAAINQARTLATQFQTQLAQMRQLSQISVRSATLPNTQQLELNILSGNTSAIPNISSNYTTVYGPVMAATDAPQSVRDLTDATDAEAQAALKKSVEIDQLADMELQAADQINQQLQAAAPGSASILDAQASAWVLRANAYTQSAMSELVRVRSIELANHGAQMKLSTTHSMNLKTNTNSIFGNPQ